MPSFMTLLSTPAPPWRQSTALIRRSVAVCLPSSQASSGPASKRGREGRTREGGKEGGREGGADEGKSKHARTNKYGEKQARAHTLIYTHIHTHTHAHPHPPPHTHTHTQQWETHPDVHRAGLYSAFVRYTLGANTCSQHRR